MPSPQACPMASSAASKSCITLIESPPKLLLIRRTHRHVASKPSTGALWWSSESFGGVLTAGNSESCALAVCRILGNGCVPAPLRDLNITRVLSNVCSTIRSSAHRNKTYSKECPMSLSVDIARSTEPRFPAVNPGDPQRFSCRGISTLSDIGHVFEYTLCPRHNTTIKRRNPGNMLTPDFDTDSARRTRSADAASAGPSNLSATRSLRAPACLGWHRGRKLLRRRSHYPERQPSLRPRALRGCPRRACPCPFSVTAWLWGADPHRSFPAHWAFPGCCRPSPFAASSCAPRR